MSNKHTTTKWKDLYTPFHGKEEHDDLKPIGKYAFPVVGPYDFLPPQNSNPKGPYNGHSNNRAQTTTWKDLYTPFRGKEDHHDELKPIGKYAFPVVKPYDFLTPRSANPLGPYKGGPPPEPTWWQKVWPIVGKERKEMDTWYNNNSM